MSKTFDELGRLRQEQAGGSMIHQVKLDPPKEKGALNARGRNSWFKAATLTVFHHQAPAYEIGMKDYEIIVESAKAGGDLPPIMLYLSLDEVRAIHAELQRVIAEAEARPRQRGQAGAQWEL